MNMTKNPSQDSRNLTQIPTGHLPSTNQVRYRWHKLARYYEHIENTVTYNVKTCTYAWY